MVPPEFDCPVCHKGKIRQHKTEHGMPQIKLPMDLGDGTEGTTEVPLLWCDVCNNIQMFMSLDKLGKIHEIGRE
jgi:hypothetical protein